MFEIFTTAFSETFLAVLRVFVIIVAAGLLVRRGVITQQQIKSLTAVTVNVFLPCLIFSNVVQTFDPGELTFWWILPVSAVVMIAFSILVAAVAFRRELPDKKNLLALSSIQNSGYLILPVGAVIYADQFDKFALYCFLFILGMSPVLWSFGKYLTTSGTREKMSWRGLLTPPFMANLVGLFFVFTRLNRVLTNPDHDICHSILQATDLLGGATVPLASFILGAILGSIAFRLRPYLYDAVRVLAVKLIITPMVVILILYYFQWCASYSLLADFFVLQAAAPPATGLILQVRNYGGDEQKISSLMLVSYILCVVSMPFWLAFWHSLV